MSHFWLDIPIVSLMVICWGDWFLTKKPQENVRITKLLPCGCWWMHSPYLLSLLKCPSPRCLILTKQILFCFHAMFLPLAGQNSELILGKDCPIQSRNVQYFLKCACVSKCCMCVWCVHAAWVRACVFACVCVCECVCASMCVKLLKGGTYGPFYVFMWLFSFATFPESIMV